MISLITPTGDRPEAFALCERWMKSQTFLEGNTDWEWLVTDDGVNPTVTTLGQKYIRLRSSTSNTQHSNMQVLLRESKGDQIIVIEDDDYYGPKHIYNLMRQLRFNTLVGEHPARYYHVRAQTNRVFTNLRHASLCQTAFHRKLIPFVMDICKLKDWIDMKLWSTFREYGGLYNGDQVVGMKGMPGRVGVSRNHQIVKAAGWNSGSIDVLRHWIGADADEYIRFKGN